MVLARLQALTSATILALSVNSAGAQTPDGEDQIHADTYHVGVAAIDITPNHAIRLNGFGSRRAESEGVRQRIWAKALAIGTDEQGPAVLITVDVLGIPDALAERLATQLAKRTAVRRERLALTATHTHTGPMLEGENETLFGIPIPSEHRAHIRDYTKRFEEKLEHVALAALADRKPAELSFGIGKVGFARNRRTEGGPVDHDLPVLAVKSLDGQLRAIYTSYACHCVTLSDNLISGDWAGYAQEALQRDYPDVIALCSVGCGADANPDSGVTGDNAEVAAAQGTEISAEISRVLKGFMQPLQGELSTDFKRITLPLQPLPTRSEWERRAQESGAVGHHARVQLARIDRGEALMDRVEAPIQSWRFGKSLALVLLPGETVVDYSLRLKSELDSSRLWVNGYANASPGYLPSERILREGGYEGGGAMIYYDIPIPYAAGLEDKIVEEVHQQLGEQYRARIDVQKTNGVPPLSAQQSVTQIETSDALRVELMLAEPLVIDPVAIDFAPDGSVWVAEMRDYPAGIEGNYEPGGRVRLVRDTNGDGTFDKSTVFLDEIPFPTGVTTWRDGVLICAAPDILYAEDVDGDDRADIKRVLFSGFGVDNYQGRINSLTYGLDGWVYGSCGLFGGEIKSFADNEAFPLGDRDFRIQPDSGAIEPATGRTQQGRVRDDWGNWFGCDNSTLLIHYPLADDFLRRNPYQLAPPARIVLDPAKELYPIVAPLLFKLSGTPGYTTAACGLGIYRDHLLGQEYTGNSFTCEPISQVVHRLQLEPQGTSFTAHRATDEIKREFLASRDGWFRPVQARTGPDGALWIVDMYRYIIEHPRWIPEADAAKVDLRAGDTMGRIYRILPRDAEAQPIARLDRADPVGLVNALDSQNGVQRDMAGQLLLWRKETSAAQLLNELAQSESRPEARLHALVVLDGLGELSNETLRELFADKSAGVRRHAARIAGTRIDKSPELLVGLLKLVQDPDAFVRIQVAVGLGETADQRAATALIQLATDHADDRFLSAAVASSINERNITNMLGAALSANRPEAPTEVVEQLILFAAGSGNVEVLNQAAFACTQQVKSRLAEWQIKGLASLLATVPQQKRDNLLEASSAKAIREALANLRETAASSKQESTRLLAIATLGLEKTQTEQDIHTLQRLFVPQESINIQLASIKSLARINRRASLQVLIEGWATASPPIKSAVFDVAVTRPDWLTKVLDLFANNEWATVDLDVVRTQRLLEAPDEAVRKRAEEIFGRTSENRRAIVESYSGAIDIAGDAFKGKLIYEKNCAACHRHGDIGQQIGPDLAPLMTKSKQYMLQAIFDPNSAVDNRFLSYVVELDDGRTFTGMIMEESAGSVTLALPDGKPQVIARSEIVDLRSTGRSMMPEGFEKEISAAEAADLLRFLQDFPARTEQGVNDGN